MLGNVTQLQKNYNKSTQPVRLLRKFQVKQRGFVKQVDDKVMVLLETGEVIRNKNA